MNCFSFFCIFFQKVAFLSKIVEGKPTLRISFVKLARLFILRPIVLFFMHAASKKILRVKMAKVYNCYVA